MSFLDAKPSDSKDSLLKDIMSAAANQSHMPGLPLRPFAALVVKVADETAETVADLKAHITHLNEQNAKLQWWVVALAIAALIGTVVQTGAAIYAISTQNQSASGQSSSFNPPATPRQIESTVLAPAPAATSSKGSAPATRSASSAVGTQSQALPLVAPSQSK